MHKFSVRRTLTLCGRTFTGLRWWPRKPPQSPLTDQSSREEPIEEHMSPAEWLADVEVAVTYRTPDPLAESAHDGDRLHGRY